MAPGHRVLSPALGAMAEPAVIHSSIPSQSHLPESETGIYPAHHTASHPRFHPPVPGSVQSIPHYSLLDEVPCRDDAGVGVCDQPGVAGQGTSACEAAIGRMVLPGENIQVSQVACEVPALAPIGVGAHGRQMEEIDTGSAQPAVAALASARSADAGYCRGNCLTLARNRLRINTDVEAISNSAYRTTNGTTEDIVAGEEDDCIPSTDYFEPTAIEVEKERFKRRRPCSPSANSDSGDLIETSRMLVSATSINRRSSLMPLFQQCLNQTAGHVNNENGHTLEDLENRDSVDVGNVRTVSAGFAAAPSSGRSLANRSCMQPNDNPTGDAAAAPGSVLTDATDGSASSGGANRPYPLTRPILAPLQLPTPNSASGPATHHAHSAKAHTRTLRPRGMSEAPLPLLRPKPTIPSGITSQGSAAGESGMDTQDDPADMSNTRNAGYHEPLPRPSSALSVTSNHSSLTPRNLPTGRSVLNSSSSTALGFSSFQSKLRGETPLHVTSRESPSFATNYMLSQLHLSSPRDPIDYPIANELGENKAATTTDPDRVNGTATPGTRDDPGRAISPASHVSSRIRKLSVPDSRPTPDMVLDRALAASSLALQNRGLPQSQVQPPPSQGRFTPFDFQNASPHPASPLPTSNDHPAAPAESPSRDFNPLGRTSDPKVALGIKTSHTFDGSSLQRAFSSQRASGGSITRTDTSLTEREAAMKSASNFSSPVLAPRMLTSPTADCLDQSPPSPAYKSQIPRHSEESTGYSVSMDGSLSTDVDISAVESTCSATSGQINPSFLPIQSAFPAKDNESSPTLHSAYDVTPQTQSISGAMREDDLRPHFPISTSEYPGCLDDLKPSFPSPQTCVSKASRRSAPAEPARSPIPSVSSSCLDPACFPCINGSHVLPLFKDFPRQQACVHYVSRDTVADLVSGVYDDKISSYVIIDCRYEYEYLGGHIDGAINVNEPFHIYELFLKLLTAARAMATKNRVPLTFPDGSVRIHGDPDFPKGPSAPPPKPCVIIFHCEYSQSRGPNSWYLFRALDRHINLEAYPNLTFPELYVMAGGYRKFYNEHRYMCVPRSFVSMFHTSYTDQRAKENIKRSSKWAADVTSELKKDRTGEVFLQHRREAAAFAAGVNILLEDKRGSNADPQPARQVSRGPRRLKLPSEDDPGSDKSTSTDAVAWRPAAQQTAQSGEIVDDSMDVTVSVGGGKQEHHHEGKHVQDDDEETVVLEELHSHICDNFGPSQLSSASLKNIFESAAQSALQERPTPSIIIHPCHNRYTRSLYPSIITPLAHSDLSHALAHVAKHDRLIAAAMTKHCNSVPEVARGEYVGLYDTNLAVEGAKRPSSACSPRLCCSKTTSDVMPFTISGNDQKDLDEYEENANELESYERALRQSQTRTHRHVSDVELKAARNAVIFAMQRQQELLDNYERSRGKGLVDDDNHHHYGDDELAYDSEREDEESGAREQLVGHAFSCETDSPHAGNDDEELRKAIADIRARYSRISFDNVDIAWARKTVKQILEQAPFLESPEACVEILKMWFDTTKTYRVGCVDPGLSTANPNRQTSIEDEIENIVTIAKNHAMRGDKRSRMFPHAGLWYELIYGPLGLDDEEVFLPGVVEPPLRARSSEVLSFDADESMTLRASPTLTTGYPDMDLDARASDHSMLSVNETESFPASSLSTSPTLQTSTSARAVLFGAESASRPNSRSSQHSTTRKNACELPAKTWCGCGCSCHIDFQMYKRTIYAASCGLDSTFTMADLNAAGDKGDEKKRAKHATASLCNDLARAVKVIYNRCCASKEGKDGSHSRDCWRDHCHPFKVSSSNKPHERSNSVHSGNLFDAPHHVPDGARGRLSCADRDHDGLRLARSVSDAVLSATTVKPSPPRLKLSPSKLPSFCVVCGCAKSRKSKLTQSCNDQPATKVSDVTADCKMESQSPLQKVVANLTHALSETGSTARLGQVATRLRAEELDTSALSLSHQGGTRSARTQSDAQSFVRYTVSNQTTSHNVFSITRPQVLFDSDCSLKPDQNAFDRR